MDTTQEVPQSNEDNTTCEPKPEVEAVVVNGSEVPTATEEKPGEQKPVEEYSSPELEKYWKAVNDNPSDFTGWTYLLQFVEQEHQIEPARDAYDAFLARYPYCYGYWKKYTDLEKKNDNLAEAEAIFERGVKAIPLSIDLWIHYINFLGAKYEGAALVTKKRQILERAVTAAGTDFRSDKLWDLYINWEKEKKNVRAVCVLYDRLLKIPTQLYRQHFESFTAFVGEHHAKRLLSLDEFLQLRRQVVQARSNVAQEEGDEAVAPPGGEAESEAPPGVEPPATGEATASQPADSECKLDDPELPAIRELIIKKRTEVFQNTEAEVSKRWNFEDRIRRPYFHVKPLEKSQLKNWRDYLDFETSQALHERVVVLFERCLIACALYEEYWLKYAAYMGAHSVDGVRNVFRRACEVHLAKKPALHLAWAAFEESQGCPATVSRVLDRLDREVPGLVMVTLRRISVERRLGNYARAEQLYKESVERAERKEEKAFYLVKYARFLAKVMNNVDGARDVLEKALEADPCNPKLLLQLVDLGYTRYKLDEQEMLSFFDRGISAQLALEHRVAFSQRKLEFLEDFGSSIARLSECYEEHQKLLRDVQNRKRKAESAENSDAKRAKSGPAPASVSAHPVTTATVTSPGVTSSTPTAAPATPDQVTSSTDAAAAAAYSAAYGQHYGYNYGSYYPGWHGYGQTGYYQT